jgi:hypothetical protein
MGMGRSLSNQGGAGHPHPVSDTSDTGPFGGCIGGMNVRIQQTGMANGGTSAYFGLS